MGWIISAIVAMSGFLAWFTRVTIANALSDWGDKFRREFKDQFADAGQAKIRMDTLQGDIDRISKRVDKVEDYAHERTHQLSNEVHQMQINLGLREKP
jgi:hypothetical protein